MLYRQIVPIMGRDTSSAGAALRVRYGKPANGSGGYLAAYVSEIKDILSTDLTNSEGSFQWRIRPNGSSVFDESYFRMFESEEPVFVKTNRGNVRRWKKRAGVDHNETWDLAVYHLALAEWFLTSREMQIHKSNLDVVGLEPTAPEANQWDLPNAHL